MPSKKPAAAKETFREKLSDVFEEMWETIGKHHMAVSGQAVGGQHPPADLTKTAKTLTYTLEMPGMTADDIQISVADGLLTVAGLKNTERSGKGAGYVFRERAYGGFTRTFSLPAEVKEDAVTANLDKGVLTITLPVTGKAKATAAKRVPIAAK